MDITYISMMRGFIYLDAVTDVISRGVQSYSISITLETGFCIEALQKALEPHGNPEIFNTDQVSHFTSTDFIELFHVHEILISLDDKSAWHDDFFVERLWRRVEYDEIYQKAIKQYQRQEFLLAHIFSYIIR